MITVAEATLQNTGRVVIRKSNTEPLVPMRIEGNFIINSVAQRGFCKYF